jgi:hypothetical protein
VVIYVTRAQPPSVYSVGEEGNREPSGEPTVMRFAKGTKHHVREVGFVLAAVAALLAACGSSAVPGVASVGSTTSPSSSAHTSSGDALRYARCMRAHGVSNFPDPTPSGEFDLPRGIKSEPQSRSAFQACQRYSPAGHPPAKHKTEREEVEYAQCMRSHGIADFPDPMPGGGFDITFNTTSPQFEAAQNACSARPDSPGIHPNGP